MIMNSQVTKFQQESRTYIAIIVVVLTSFLSIALSNVRHSLIEWMIMLAVGVAYTLFTILAIHPLCLNKKRLSFFFTVQIMLGLALVYWGRGDAFLIMMPIPSIAVILLPRVGQIVVGAVVIFGEVCTLGIQNHWVNFSQDLMTMFAAVAFVIIFTQVAVKEQEIRAEAERLAKELREANQKLREYAVQVEELAVAKERNRLSRDIHDTLGHYLTAIHMQINAAKAVFNQDHEKAFNALNKAQDLASESLNEVRRAVAALRITPLENKQLLSVLEELVEESSATGIKTSFVIQGVPRRLETQVELALYRSVQEGLTNVRKHSHATEVEVSIDFSSENSVLLSIKDNGQGTIQKDSMGFGLIGLRERLSLCGGELRIVNTDEHGFALEAEVPG